MKNSKHGVGLKILFIGIIVLILSIGLLVIRGLLTGREYTYDSAIRSINDSAGATFHLSEIDTLVKGKHSWYSEKKVDGKIEKELHTETTFNNFSLKKMDVTADLKTDIRKLGIYSAPVYTGQVTVKSKLIYDLVDTEDNVYYPSESLITFDVTNKNLTSHPIVKVNGTEYTADIINGSNGSLGITCPLVQGENDIEILMNIRGAEIFVVDPIAGENTLLVNCDWTSPSFTFGDYLPDYRDINENGFTAQWNVPFPNKDRMVGFRYVQPVDLYKLLDRSITYGFLFIIVPFIVMFLFELFANINLHPMNYLLCGAACIVFFLLLLALSEHFAFTASYIIGSCAASLLISFYLSSVTKKLKIGFAMLASFVVLYAYLFFSLKSEDYAFLIGAVFIFIILALVMFFTRNVDWSSLGKKKETLPLPDPAQS